MNNLALFKMRILIRYAVISIFAGLSILQASCVYDGDYYGPPPRYRYHPPYYDYYYYPYARVYFHFTTGIYYYLDGDVWVKTRVLPPHIHIDAANRVRIRTESAIPYLKFKEHVRIHKSKPNYSVDPERSRKEREANRRWFKEYQQQYPKGKKRRDNY